MLANKLNYILALAVALSAACGGAQAARESVAVEVHALTGAHTRLVWVQHDGTDVFAAGRQLVLMRVRLDDPLIQGPDVPDLTLYYETGS